MKLIKKGDDIRAFFNDRGDTFLIQCPKTKLVHKLRVSTSTDSNGKRYVVGCGNGNGISGRLYIRPSTSPGAWWGLEDLVNQINNKTISIRH